MELVADANVLIDYAKTDPSILTLHVKHFGPIFVPSVILDEVDQLTASDCETLGLTIVEESLEILSQTKNHYTEHANKKKLPPSGDYA